MNDTITLPRSVVEQALEALNASMPHNNDMDEDWPSHIAARRALRAALEQPTRQPLTEETIYDLWDEKFRSWIGGEPFEVVVKAIERAHGIGGEA